MKTITAFLIYATILCMSSLIAQEIRATFDDGRTVMLRANGKWFFVNRTPPVDGQAVIFNGKVVNLKKNGEWEKTTITRPVVPSVVPSAYHAVSAPGAQTAAHPFLAQQTPSIITADGSTADRQRLTQKKIVLLYFSASWCSPCRAFTPKLVDFYNEHGGGDKFEVLFVSNDRTQEAMHNYLIEDRMPWIALAWGSESRPVLAQKYCGPGIPCLVMLDENDAVISDSYVGGQYVGPAKVLGDLKIRLGIK